MRTVMDSSMVAHVWAQQTQAHARTRSGNCYFDGPRLYSYGSHYLVGLFAAPGGPVFLNADSNSKTTNGHRYEARSAVSHLTAWSIPNLTAIAGHLQNVARGHDSDTDRNRLRDYLTGYWQAFPADSEAAAWILRRTGTRGTWAAFRARLARAARKADAESAARNKAAAIRQGRELVATPWPVEKGRAWIAARSYGQRDLCHMVADYRAARLATPKAHKRVRATLWQRETALRAIMARAESDGDRHGNPGNRTRARAYIAELRKLREGRPGFVPGYDGPDGQAKLLATLALESGTGWHAIAERLRGLAPLVHMPPAMRAAMQALHDYAAERSETMETAARDAKDMAEGLTELVRGLQAFNRARRMLRTVQAARDSGDMNCTESAYLSNLQSVADNAPDATPWRARRLLELRPDLAARMKRVAERAESIVAELAPAIHEARAAKVREQEAIAERRRQEAARIAAMSPDELRAAWESGEVESGHAAIYSLTRETGPLLRAIHATVDGCTVKSGELETSQGARVPLRHAFRVFQFVALCRAERKAWKPGAFGPGHIRVGHFTVDAIDSTGDFRAGCHSIQWAEVERLAKRLGVADCLATLPEVTAELAGVPA